LNFRVFRRKINAPLLVVEHSHTGQFELSPSDADVLIQIRGGDVMWQKERLLNIGLERLAPECEYVAWIDCDTVFERRDWYEAAVAQLQRTPLCQMFRTVYHLGRDANLDFVSGDDSINQHESIGYALAAGLPTLEGAASDGGAGMFRHGYAWCARRSLIQELGLYDRHILGSGDAAMAYAATNQDQDFIRHKPQTAAHAADYRGWAARFRQRGPWIGYVDGGLFHLWHGELANRGYGDRQQVLFDHDYDPATDIAWDTEGCWRWNSPKPGLHRAVLDYFHQRGEDDGLHEAG
jgi:hypothetical protein